MKRFSYVLTMAFLALSLLIPSGVFAADLQSSEPAQPVVSVYMDGKRINFEVDPVIEKGTTLVPFRAIFEQIGLRVGWDGSTQTVMGRSDTLSIDMVIGSRTATVNEATRRLDVAPALIGGRTMIPLRFVSEVSGKQVLWDAETYRIDINSGVGLVKEYNPFGNDGYIELEDIPDHTGVRPNIHWDGEYLYSTWTKDVSFRTGNDSTIEGTQIFLSVAREGQWLRQAEQVYFKQKNSGNRFELKYFDGSYYLREGTTITKLTPESTGQLKSTTFTSSLLYDSSDRGIQWTPMWTVQGVGIFVMQDISFTSGSNTYTTSYKRIYYPSTSTYNNYVDVKDIHNVMTMRIKPESMLYNHNSGYVYIVENGSYRQLDIVKGDLLYDSAGKDLVTPIVKEATSSSQLVINDGQLVFFYGAPNESTFTMLPLDINNLTPITREKKFTTIELRGLQNKSLFWDGKTLYAFSPYEYSRKPSVKGEKYELITKLTYTGRPLPSDWFK